MSHLIYTSLPGLSLLISPGFQRAGAFSGKIKKGVEGTQLISGATGTAEMGGTYQLTGWKKYGAKLVGADTKRSIVQKEVFKF